MAQCNSLLSSTLRGKQLTNFRVTVKGAATKITPPILLTLEYAVEFIAADELVEITLKSIRIGKRHLKEPDCEKAAREQGRRPRPVHSRRGDGGLPEPSLAPPWPGSK